VPRLVGGGFFINRNCFDGEGGGKEVNFVTRILGELEVVLSKGPHGNKLLILLGRQKGRGEGGVVRSTDRGEPRGAFL